MHSRTPLIAWLFAIAWLVSCLASAQTLYKSTMPDGKVIYGDKPVPGAVKVEAPNVTPASKGIAPPTAQETQALKRLEADRARRDSTESSVRAAEKALSDAEAALAAGKEPREGERVGTAKGGSRLSEAYFERQKVLEAVVEQARRNLEVARGGGSGVAPVGPPPQGSFGPKPAP
jgi:hypothetical protein